MKEYTVTISIKAPNEDVADAALLALIQGGGTLEAWPEDAEIFGCGGPFEDEDDDDDWTSIDMDTAGWKSL